MTNDHIRYEISHACIVRHVLLPTTNHSNLMRPSILSVIIALCMPYTYIYGNDMQDLRAVMAAQAGQPAIDIPSGTYLLDFSTTRSPISLSGLSDVVIDFHGATIVCNQQQQAFNIKDCKNLVIKNFYLEYDPPTCTQGTITAINGSTWDVELHENYPTQNIKLQRTQVYDADTRELVRNFTTIWEGRQTLTWTGERTLQLTGLSNSAVKPGDFVVLTVLPESYTPHAIYLSRCVDCKLENVTVYDSNCFSFFETDCSNTHYYRCAVTRKTNDPKYPVDRLRAGYADGIHSKHATIGPTIEECTLEHSGDDCIAINGSFYPVYKTDASTKTVFILTPESMASNIKPKKEDVLVGVNNNGTLRGEGMIQSIVTAYPTSSERTACFNKLSNIREQDTYRYGAKITLTEWIDGLATGDMVYSNNRIGSGFKVINNSVGHNRSRAILIKASDGEITGNKIDHSAMSAIAIAPEFYWLEAGCSQNLTIAGNTISDCMYDASMMGSSQAAALTVVAEAPNGKLAACGAFANIDIHGNTITGCPFPAIFLNSINGGYCYDNILDNTPAFTRRHGANFGIPSTRAEYRLNCNISLSAPEASVANPAIDASRIFVENGQVRITPADEPTTVSLTTPAGVCLGQWSIQAGDDMILPDLNHGIYIVRITGRNGASSQKIIL